MITEELKGLLKDKIEEIKEAYIDVSDDSRTKVFQALKKLEEWFDSLPYEEQLKIYNENPDLIIRTRKIGGQTYNVYSGDCCENCIFGELQDQNIIMSKELLEDWPCDEEGGCKHHYKKLS